MDQNEILEIKSNFEKFKPNFQQTQCKKCKTKRIMHSWSKLDLAAMAKKTKLDNLYFSGYFYPTLQSHATTSSMLQRLKPDENMPISFNEESQPKMADRALIIAHNLLIRLINNQNAHFKLDIDKDIEQLSNDFQEMWGRQTDT
jgi:hypothetical protein